MEYTKRSSTQPMQFDMSSLMLPVSAEDVAAYKSRHDGKAAARVGDATLVGVLAGGVMVAAVCGQLLEWTNLLLVVVSGVLCAVAGALGARYYALRLAQKRYKLDRFATRHNLEYIVQLQDPDYKGLMFTVGRERSITEALRLPDAAEIGNYECVLRTDSRAQTIKIGYIKISLSRALPHMILDARSNNIVQTNLPTTFNRSQVLSLEGNFDTYFTLYAPEQCKVDALYLFTPDVMQLLIEHGREFDMEVIEKDLYFYYGRQFDLQSEADLKLCATMISLVSGKIKKQTRSYATVHTMTPTLKQGSMPQRSPLLKTKSGVYFPLAVLFGVMLVACALGAYAVYTNNYTIILFAAILCFPLVVMPLVVILFRMVYRQYRYLRKK